MANDIVARMTTASMISRRVNPVLLVLTRAVDIKFQLLALLGSAALPLSSKSHAHNSGQLGPVIFSHRGRCRGLNQPDDAVTAVDFYLTRRIGNARCGLDFRHAV